VAVVAGQQTAHLPHLVYQVVLAVAVLLLAMRAVLVQQTKAMLVGRVVAIVLHIRLVAAEAERALLALTLQLLPLQKRLVMVVRVLHLRFRVLLLPTLVAVVVA